MSRRALITGAASGLASGFAPMLAADGYTHIAITYRNTPPDLTIAAIHEAGAQASASRIDFLDTDDTIEASFAGLLAEHGPFDTLIHAVGPLVVKRFARLSMADYHEMFDGNVRSAILASRAVLPAMRASRFGRLVFFGMNGSSETRPFRGFTLHQAAKSAVIAFVRSLAMEEARYGITVNAIEPGDIRNKNVTRAQALEASAPNPRGRPGSFEDIGDVVRFLVAAERDFITGAVIAVSGGLSEADERNAAEINEI